MKREFILLGLIILMTGMASATICNMQTILIHGHVYETNTTNTVADANVIATCTHNGINTTKSGVSKEDGRFTVLFDKRECDYNDKVVVYSEKFGTSGPEMIGSIVYIYPYGCSAKVDNFNPNVQIPIIPEFGWAIGILTAVSAVSVFFVVRKHT